MQETYNTVMLDVFSNFPTTPYTFIVSGQGGIYGNSVIAQFNAQGIFKLRRGITDTSYGEVPTSTATLHIKPSETFVSTYRPLEGHGVIVNGNQYRIVGVTEGMNFDTNVLEHITLTLQVEDFAS